MRILQLRFQNLNSLAGEWQVDFTDPAYINEGIFAITGPTGAGKSTILDAICLALYGCTPRLPTISGSANELMSRQTGECFAEVEFETAKGQFRAHWSQRRARAKPQGKLQQPQHEIADVRSGKVLESKLRPVARRIIDVTGMDFERFTRSMLLAQGGFAAFLQAKADERAPILEQITGTGIYSDISIRVHERRAAEKGKLEALQAETAGMRLLDAEEEAALASDFEQKSEQTKRVLDEIGALRDRIEWLDSINRLQIELHDNQRQLERWQQSVERFSPDRERLEWAKRALELDAEFSLLEGLRRAQKKDREQHELALAQLPKQRSVVDELLRTQQKAIRQVEECQKRQSDLLPVLNQVRVLDVQITASKTALAQAEADLLGHDENLAAVRLAIEKDAAQLEQQRHALNTVISQVKDSQADAALVAELEGIRSRIDALQRLEVRRREKEERLSAQRSDIEKLAKCQRQQKAALDKQQTALNEHAARLQQRQEALSGLLRNRPAAEWRQEQLTLMARAAQLSQLEADARRLLEMTSETDELSGQRKRMQATLADVTNQDDSLRQQRELLEQQLALLEDKMRLMQRIESLEEARQQLREGEPCPLCGALDHPWGEGEHVVDNAVAEQLKDAKAKLTAVNNAIHELEIGRVSTAKDLEQVEASLALLRQQQSEMEAGMRKACAQLSLDAKAPGLVEEAARLQQEIGATLAEVTAVVESIEDIDNELTALREAHEQARETVANLEREQQQAVYDLSAAQQAETGIRKEIDELKQEYDNAMAVLRRELAQYVELPAAIIDLPDILLQLENRRQQWLKRQDEKNHLEAAIGRLEISIQHHQSQQQQLTKARNAAKAEVEAQKNALADIEEKRFSLFGSKMPNEEEKRLAAALENAAATLEQAREEADAASRSLADLERRIDDLDAAMTARADELLHKEAAFADRLHASGFADEKAFLSSRLSEQERKILEEKAQELSTKKLALETARDAIEKKLHSLREQSLTTESREAIVSRLEEKQRQHAELQQEIGAIREKLDQNTRLKARLEKQLQAIEAQRQECSRWDLLHDLIGSADGKKYRNFAQGLTFELMIAHANRQLQKMTDRYLLVLDRDSPLELNVIDNYQAGEIRSTKNLSGGESFIVSLSLALGLSRMASQNVRVDSLFLDEGFGTLDEDALETALGTLSGLHQDGKLIGVISHVAALKERIPTQIEVVPGPGGRSVIKGPGCAAMEDKAN